MDALFENSEYNTMSTVVASHFENIITLDYHYKYGQIYYSDVGHDHIGRCDISYNGKFYDLKQIAPILKFNKVVEST